MTRLAVMRHAPTEWSAAGRLQGRVDIALGASGREAAGALRLPAPIDAFARVSSPLVRCQETAALLQPSAPFAIEPRLVEMDFGAWEGRTLAEIHESEGEAARAREGLGLDFRAPGGESPREVQARLAPWLATLGAAGTDTLAVAHKAVIRALYALASRWAMVGRPPHRLRMDCLHLFAVGPDGMPSILELNLPLCMAAREEAATR
jgi:probable phosphoglycerate mutase